MYTAKFDAFLFDQISLIKFWKNRTCSNRKTPVLESLDLKNIYFENICKRPSAVARRGFVKKVFLEISQNSQEITLARVSFLIQLQARPS